MGVDNKFTVVDIETTGLSPYRHKITEISGAVLYKGRIMREFTTLVNPEVHIPSFITRLTGITDELVKGAPLIKEVMPKFLRFLGKNTFVAHNAWFDLNFLEYNLMKHMRKTIDNDVLCTCKLARRLLPYLPSKKLGSICEHFEIKNEEAHRARGDTIATAEVLRRFLDMLEKRGIREHHELIDFQKSKAPKLSYMYD